MAIPNQKLREILFLLLFAEMQGMKDETATIELVMDQLKVSKSNVLRMQEKAKLIQAKIHELDDLIQAVVVSYDLERIQTIEKTALRLGAYELLYCKELPPKVAIAEALRLTKKFGTPAATSFVNALLDALYKLEQGKVVDKEEIQHSLEELQQSEQISHEASLNPPLPNSE
jgi:N utilization substance protein B